MSLASPVRTAFITTALVQRVATFQKMNAFQRYSLASLVREVRILKAVIFGIFHNNLSYADFNLLLPDVMAIADKVGSQLAQSIERYEKLMVSMQFSAKKAHQAGSTRIGYSASTPTRSCTLLHGDGGLSVGGDGSP